MTELPDDIAGLKQIVASIQRQQQEFLRNSPDAIIVTDASGKIQDWNHGAVSLYGWEADEARGRLLLELLPHEYLGTTEEEVLASLEESGAWNGEVQQRRRDGSPLFVHSSVTRIRPRDDQGTRIARVNRDITPEKVAQAALVQRAAFESLVSDLTASFLRLSHDQIDGALVDALEKVGRFLGVERCSVGRWDPEDGEAITVSHFWRSSPEAPPHPSSYDFSEFPTVLSPFLTGQPRTWKRSQGYLPEMTPEEVAFLEQTGTESFAIFPMNFEARIRLCLGFVQFQDPEELSPELLERLRLLSNVFGSLLARQQSEESMLRHQARIALDHSIATAFLTSPPETVMNEVLTLLLKALESPVGCLGMIDPTGTLRCTLPGNEPPIELSPSDWDGFWGRCLEERETTIQDGPCLLPGHDAPLDAALAVPLVHGGKLLGQFVVGGKTTGYREADRTLLQEVASQAALVLAVRRERDQQQRHRTRLEEQLGHSQKMEAVGRLAGGIAHDFNNLLMAINNFADFALEDLAPDSPIRTNLEQIRLAGGKAAALTSQLLVFSRRQRIQSRPFDPHQVIEDLEPMLRRIIGEDVELRLQLAPTSGVVHADPGQLEQVLMNLVVNARDAMPRGGTLTLGSTLEQEPGRPGCIRLSVADTGVGMSPELQEKAFEPFFTTKGRGRGTGLGLAIVYGIVTQAGGRIELESQEGQGTQVDILLPLLPGETPPTLPTRQEVDLRGEETVLVVDDEESIREVVRKMLASAGYEVLLASNGGEAVLQGERHGERISLLVTDVVMPLMGGPELVRRLTRLLPDLRTLYISGFTGDAGVDHQDLDEDIPLLRKPFSRDELLLQVRRCLDA